MSSALSPGIHSTRDGDIATVTLSNPGKLNALTVTMWRELASAFAQLSADDSLRCIVIRGAGDEAFAVLYPAPHQHGARMEHWGYLGTTFAF